MKTIITCVALLVAMLIATPTPTTAQHVEGLTTITATLGDLDSLRIYSVRNYAGITDLDSTLTVRSDVQPAYLQPPSALVIEPNTGSGMVAGETDSLLLRIRPLVYDWADGEYAEITDVFYYASFGQVAHLVTARTALDWDTGAEYYVALKDSNGTPLFRGAGGVSIEVIQRNAAGGWGTYTIQPLYELDNK